jgi:hypothetical protein
MQLPGKRVEDLSTGLTRVHGRRATIVELRVT